MAEAIPYATEGVPAAEYRRDDQDAHAEHIPDHCPAANAGLNPDYSWCFKRHSDTHTLLEVEDGIFQFNYDLEFTFLRAP